MDYDLIFGDAFDVGGVVTADDVGGVHNILQQGRAVGLSRYADLIFDLVVSSREQDVLAFEGFLFDLLKSIKRAPEFRVILDRVINEKLLATSAEKKLFKLLRQIGGDRVRNDPIRVSALRAATMLLRDDDVRIAGLVATIAETETDETPFFLEHLARVAGILHERSSSPALTAMLYEIATNDETLDQAHFELGLIDLRKAIESFTQQDVLRSLKEASDHFRKSTAARESRHDAKMYQIAVELLLQFSEHQVPRDFREDVACLRREVFAYTAYTGANALDPMLGSIASQGAALMNLAQSLSELNQRLDDDFWFEASSVIENHLVLALSANRTIFTGRAGIGLDTAIRPRLTNRVFANRNHGNALKAWLRERSGNLDADLVSELRSAMEHCITSGGSLVSNEAGLGEHVSSAALEKLASTDPTGLALLKKIAQDAAATMAANVTLPSQRMIETVNRVVQAVDDYRQPSVQSAFDLLVFHLATFLSEKIDSSRQSDAYSAYLFCEKPLPHEKELQQDFLRHGRSVRLDVEPEVIGKAGGRADIRYKSTPHEMIIEVKRELEDSEFGNLLSLYGQQTAIYQNSNVKLGVLFVLDLSASGPVFGHFDTLYDVRIGDFLNDGTQRGLVILKVPGRRSTPNVATKEAKARTTGANRPNKLVNRR
ncbi:hypothetical protein [Rhizobium sp.]|uniref:hypothetical protein n=1 Tax=Rhizobium sp. TaxID=391 RepID=UPI00289A2325